MSRMLKYMDIISLEAMTEVTGVHRAAEDYFFQTVAPNHFY